MSERYRGPLIAGFYVCRDCGCVVQDREAHDDWHEEKR
jgi:transcription initiation factor TFIIIB Brf1 subunit/transcription initiation factor TFIIB